MFYYIFKAKLLLGFSNNHLIVQALKTDISLFFSLAICALENSIYGSCINFFFKQTTLMHMEFNVHLSILLSGRPGAVENWMFKMSRWVKLLDYHELPCCYIWSHTENFNFFISLKYCCTLVLSKSKVLHQWFKATALYWDMQGKCALFFSKT